MSFDFKKKNNYGFTLMELLVSITILTILSMVIFGNRNQYSKRLILRNEVYNVALHLRQAQVYSTGAKGFKSGSNPTDFDIPYGVYFEISSPNQFRFFVDENSDGKFTTAEQNEIKYFPSGISIQLLCAVMFLPGPFPLTFELCSDTTSLRRIPVTFRRPSSNAIIKLLDNGPNGGAGIVLGANIIAAKIYITASSGITSWVKIDTTGGISVQ